MVAIALNPPRQNVDRFYVAMALTCVVIAFGGFAPTYWLQLIPGTFVGPPLLHIHGLLFSAWPVLLLTQALLVANRRLDLHRAFGLAGISLATAMIVVGLAAGISTLDAGLAAGYGDRARAFLILPVSSIGLFACFIAFGVANVRRPQAHKRLMLLATIALLQAAMGRVFFVLMSGGGPGLRPGLGEPPPVNSAVIGSLLLELLIVAGVLYDWRTRGRPHPVWLIGAAIMTAVVILRGPMSGTGTWLAFADFLSRIAG
jgi:hypothetical protein